MLMPASPPTLSLPDNIEDFMAAFCGERLGTGVARTVYVFRIQPRYVIKVEHGHHDWQNVHEWEVWQAAGPKTMQWLAPCVAISPGGTVLIQERVEPITKDRLPKAVPSFLADLKDDNWGWYDGRAVAVDYGRHRLFEGVEKSRLVKAHWYDGFGWGGGVSPRE